MPKDILDVKKRKETKLVYINFPNREKIKLALFGDTHIGHPKLWKDKLTRDINLIKSETDAVIGMGDYGDCVTARSYGSLHEQTHSPPEQFEILRQNVFGPMGDKSKLLLLGNHEERIIKETNNNYVSKMCTLLDIPYGGYQASILLRVGNQTYQIAVEHGSTGSRKLSYKVKKCKEMKDVFAGRFDVYAMAHTHTLHHRSENLFIINRRNKTLENFEQHFILTGHYLNRPRYVEKSGRSLSPCGCPILTFYGDKHKINYDDTKEMP